MEAPSGKPSSEILPASVTTLLGKVSRVWLAVMATVGAWLGAGGFTVMVTLTEDVSCESEALNFRAYVPAAENVMEVFGLFGLLNVAAAGPLTWVHWMESVEPVGKPSSVTVPFTCTMLAGCVITVLSTLMLREGGRFC